jgi:hypothetical protein
MKRIITIIVLAVSAFSLSSCGFAGGIELKDQMQYNISFVFQDAEGNNLAEGIDLEDWTPVDVPKEQATFGQVVSDYKLDIILSKQSDKFNSTNEYYHPILIYTKTDDCICIGNNLILYTGLAEPQNKLTYHITCPYIFGDEEIHVITTYWKELGNKHNATYLAECYMVEFDGQTITDIRHDPTNRTYRENYVTLTINR